MNGLSVWVCDFDGFPLARSLLVQIIIIIRNRIRALYSAFCLLYSVIELNDWHTHSECLCVYQVWTHRRLVCAIVSATHETRVIFIFISFATVVTPFCFFRRNKTQTKMLICLSHLAFDALCVRVCVCCVRARECVCGFLFSVHFIFCFIFFYLFFSLSCE